MPRLDHINNHTRDARRMREFLASVLGIREGHRPPFRNPGHWLYFEGQDHAAIQLNVIEAEADFPLGVINHVAFAFYDLDETLSSVEASGYPFKRTEIPDTDIIQIFVTGPEGILVEIQCRRADEQNAPRT